MSWGHFPPSWVLDGNELKAFRAGATTGQHIAALKCYLAIAGVVNFTTKAADVSLTALEDITGCSRPMVIRGVRVLADRHLVTVDASNLTHRYTLDRFDDALKPRFSKVPELVSTQLCELPNRGQTALSAIKILILLLTLRDNYSNRAMVRHDKIRSYCGMHDVPPLLSSTPVWSPIPHPKEIGREEALFRRADHWLPA